MAESIQLTAAMRSNLLQLQKTQDQISKKETNLSTGNKINSALDGPTSYFAAKSLSTRASDLTSLKDAMGQSVSTIKAANAGLEKISDMLDQAKGLTTSAYSALGSDAASVATRANLAKQFNELLKQIDAIAQDSGYAGKNLIAGNGQNIDSTTTTRAAVNTIAGLSNASVSNASSTDTYSIRVSGDGAITAQTQDVTDAETAHGLTSLKVSGKMSATAGTFSDVSLTVTGAAGKTRSFVITDGTETRTINYFDNSQTATDTLTQAATSSAAAIHTLQIGGTIEAGDTFSFNIEGQNFSYTATAADVALGQNAANNVATKLRASINTAVTSGRLSSSNVASVGTVGTNGTSFTVTGKTDSTGKSAVNITVSPGQANAATLHISQSFASGAVVSFTVNRAALEAASNGGNGTSTLEKKVNIQVQVQNLTGTIVTRDGLSQRGEGKLANGANAYAFDSGTVRFDLDEKKIMAAASLSKAANLTTVQVSAANTNNDMAVQFNEKNTSSLNIAAENLTTSGLGMKLDKANNNWMDRSDIDQAAANITNAQAHLRSVSQNLSTNLNIVTTREDFTKNFSDVLTEGSNKLIQVDQNDEAAQLLALQTRQQLGTTALSLANQSQQAVLRLF